MGALCGLLYAINFSAINTAFIIFAVFIIFLSKPSVYLSFSRRFRDIIRFCDGIVGAFAITSAFVINIWLGLSVFAVLFTIKSLFNRERNASKVCCGCAELKEGKTCSGYREQMQAMLDLEEEFCKTLTIRKEMLL